MKWNKPVALLTAVASTVLVSIVGMTSAHADSFPTFQTTHLTQATDAWAEGYYAGTSPLSNLLGTGYPKTASYCTQDDRDHTTLIPVKTKVVNAGVITSKCHISEEGDSASSSSTVATVSLLGGLIKIKGIQSSCNYDGDTLTVGSVAASVTIAKSAHFVPQLGGHLFRGPNGSFLGLDESFVGDGYGYTYAIELYTAPVMLGSLVLVPAQYVEIGYCEIDGNAPEEG